MRARRRRRGRLIRATLLAVIGLLDNITTHMALQAGAVEVNPLVRLFVGDTTTFAVFTVLKCLALFHVAYNMIDYSNKWDRAIYYMLLAVFTQATIINTMNALR